jgi:thiamine transport system permease protein
MACEMGCGDEKLKTTFGQKAIGLIPVGFVILFFLLPIVVLGQEVAAVSLPGRLQESLLWASTFKVAMSAALQAMMSAGVALLAGLPLAYLISNFDFRWKKLLQALVFVPFVLPTLVTGLAIRQIFNDFLDPGLLLLVIAHAYVNLAVVVRVVGNALEGIDNRYLISAQALGATNFKVLWSLLLPLVKSAIVRAYALVFVFSFSSLGLVLVLGGSQQTLETRLLRQVSLLVDFPAASVTAAMQFLVVVMVLLLTNRSKQKLNNPDRFVPQQLPRALGALVWLAIFLFSFPLLWLVISSLKTSSGFSVSNWQQVLQEADTWQALSNSIEVSILAALITGLIAVATAVTVKAGNLGKAMGVLALPLSVSSVTVGLGLLLAVRSREILLVSDWLLPSLAHSLVALPFVAAIVIPPIRALDLKWVTSAEALGAAPIRAQATAVTPILKRVLPSVFSITVAISLGEFGAASFLANYQDPTMSVLLLRLLSRPAVEAAGMASVLAVLLMLATLALTFIWQQQDEAERIEGVKK